MLNTWVSILIAGLHSTIMWTLFAKKLITLLAFLRRNLKHCHQRVKLDAYKIFVLPILNYAATVWSPHMQYYINKLEAVQKHLLC